MRSALSLAALALPARASAHAPDAFGLGSRAAAMGGTGTASATDFTAVYYNPAGLAGARGLGLGVAYTATAQHLQIGGRDAGVPAVRGTSLGLVAPGVLAGIPFALGLAAYLPDEGLTRNRAIAQETPRWEIYGERMGSLYFGTALAARPFPWLEIGAGLGYLASTGGRFEVNGRVDLINPYSSKLRHEVDADLKSVEYPEAGLRVLLPGLGALGATYRGEAKIELQLAGRLAGVVDFAGLEVPVSYALEATTIAAFTPQQVALGATLTRFEGLVVNVDVTWVDWSAYENPVARTTATLDATLPPGVPIELPPPPKAQVVEAPAFEDRFVPRIGVEYALGFGASSRPRAGSEGGEEELPRVRVPLRAGYAFESSPVPPQTGRTNFVDADRHTFSIGAGVALHRPGAAVPGTVRLDVHGAYSVLPERTTLKANPADFVGDYRASGSMIGGGATLALDFD